MNVDRVFGCSFILAALIQFAFIALKILEAISWSWAWVLSPTFFYAGVLTLVGLVLAFLSFLGVIDVEG